MYTFWTDYIKNYLKKKRDEKKIESQQIHFHLKWALKSENILKVQFDSWCVCVSFFLYLCVRAWMCFVVILQSSSLLFWIDCPAESLIVNVQGFVSAVFFPMFCYFINLPMEFQHTNTLQRCGFEFEIQHWHINWKKKPSHYRIEIYLGCFSLLHPCHLALVVSPDDFFYGH